MSLRPLTGPRWARPVFRLGSRPYTWLDVALGAMLRGDWERFEAHLRAGAAGAAEADRMGAWPEAHEVEEAATAFRYARDLLTSEETEAWLADAGLTLETWSEVLARDLLRARLAEQPDALPAPGALPEDDELIAAEGLCSGMFAVFAHTLAERMALAATASGAVDTAGVAADVADARRRHAAWLAALDGGEVDRRLAHLAAADRAAGAVARDAAVETALAQHLDRFRLEWMRVDLERLSFGTAEAAREAAWCVREDGLTLSEVAMESRQPVQDVRALLDTLEAPLRDAVLSARLEEVVGPVDVGGRFDVALVVGKGPATLADPLVRARAERSVIEAVTARAVLAHVTWVGKPAL